MGTSSTGSDENADTAPMDIDVFSSDSDESSGDDEEAMVGTSTTPANKRAASKRRKYGIWLSLSWLSLSWSEKKIIFALVRMRTIRRLHATLPRPAKSRAFP